MRRNTRRLPFAIRRDCRTLQDPEVYDSLRDALLSAVGPRQPVELRVRERLGATLLSATTINAVDSASPQMRRLAPAELQSKLGFHAQSKYHDKLFPKVGRARIFGSGAARYVGVDLFSSELKDEMVSAKKMLSDLSGMELTSCPERPHLSLLKILGFGQVDLNYVIPAVEKILGDNIELAEPAVVRAP